MKTINRLCPRMVHLIHQHPIWIVRVIQRTFARRNMRESNKRHRMKDLQAAARRTVVIFTLSLNGILVLWAQNPQPTLQPKIPVQQSSQSSPNILPAVQLDSAAALHHLNQIISWYRHATTGIQSVGLPSDAIYQDNAQSLGAQIVRLAFQSAKAETAITTAQQKAGNTNSASGETTQQQSLAQLQAKTSSQIDQLQSQVETLNSQISKAPP